MSDDHVDGNALAGDLREIFAVDLTVATGQCSGCGYRGSVATLRVYQNAPGIVARCRTARRSCCGWSAAATARGSICAAR
ncbi:DUF6510 family protein [Lentzea sp. BCCO 10_0061]|uniref:DUF6510 family protein n=1 Tax=Lentzea sokolovensis TaxID=3095429 RepID=A0ABU4V744_9PSEU|nr:DUF6510 family protein [Lentzea sp. BCCO 10_0061]MDX8147494.1 DUF6510 family protein [Lentzea sp. BCCO 10_0061]